MNTAVLDSTHSRVSINSILCSESVCVCVTACWEAYHLTVKHGLTAHSLNNSTVAGQVPPVRNAIARLVQQFSVMGPVAWPIFIVFWRCCGATHPENNEYGWVILTRYAGVEACQMSMLCKVVERYGDVSIWYTAVRCELWTVPIEPDRSLVRGGQCRNTDTRCAK